jgi:hemolysin activation/secretion protein
LNLSATGQKALRHKNLDTSEQFNATGAGKARAYRESSSSDNGYHLSAEARYTLPSKVDKLTHAVGIFADKSGWKREKNWHDATGHRSENYADLGLSYHLNYGQATLKVELAHALGAWHHEDDHDDMGPARRTSVNALLIVAY